MEVLDEAQIQPVVALLMASSDHDDWRFVLSSPSLDQHHPLKAYEQVTAALKGRFVHTLPLLLVLPTKDPFVREIRRLFGKTKEVLGMRLGGQSIGNRFISNAYLYRVR